MLFFLKPIREVTQHFQDLSQHVVVKGKAKEQRHRPDHRYVEIKRVDIQFKKMFCGHVKLRVKINEVFGFRTFVNRENLLDKLSIFFDYAIGFSDVFHEFRHGFIVVLLPELFKQGALFRPDFSHKE